MGHPLQSAVAIIPARLGSTRFPRKVLASETGKPMVVHVCEQAAKASSVSRVIVATDSLEIREAVKAHGYECVMTSCEHPNGTSRLHEAATSLNLRDHEQIINVQGDEPEIDPAVIDACLDCRGYGLLMECVCGTVVARLESEDQRQDPNIVKAVTSIDLGARPVEPAGTALYFSRSAIPHGTAAAFRHIGVYSYAVDALAWYVKRPPGPLEVSERLEQLRWLEGQHQIAVGLVETTHTGIDTPEQYAAFVERWKAKQAGVQ